MKRFFRLSLLATLLIVLSYSSGLAQTPTVQVSGRIHPADVRIFVKDSIYIINKEYVVGGTLIIEPGTQVKFQPQGRLVDSTGGRIIADGFAEAAYSSLPSGLNPKASAGSASNPYSWTGYADMNYFDFRGNATHTTPTIDVKTVRDLTIHSSKENYIYNVVLDKTARKIKNLFVDEFGTPKVLDNAGNLVDLNASQSIISFERAIMLVSSRLQGDQWTKDPVIDINAWKRLGSKSSDFGKAKISFITQQDNNFSREWGHIVVLPGARAAFFRNVEFDGFRKDTAVDRGIYYSANQAGGTSAEWNALNKKLVNLTTGAGGAITTFSSRTWLINAEFTNNQAKYRGGALQILETPSGFPTAINGLAGLRTVIANKVGGSGNYPLTKNPNVTNNDGSVSSVLADKPVPQIDMIDEANGIEPLTDGQRAAFDDARIAGLLGRIRNLRFENNQAINANIAEITIPNTTIKIVDYDTVNAGDYPLAFNGAYGGAIYIAGEEASENRKIEFGLGVNNSINRDLNNNGIYEDTELTTFPVEDYLILNNNQALNMQKNGGSFGAKGGAIYLGRYTSLIVGGEFTANTAEAPKFKLENNGSRKGIIVEKYSRGGAIFQENTYGRLQLRGGPSRDEIVDYAGVTISNPTRFEGNRAGAGGAVYVDGNTDPSMSPYIGGTDATINTRDYGFNIQFNNNEAYAFGGAIFTKRHFRVQGAGGVEADQLLGYGGNYPVRFSNNTADFAGGAIHVEIPRAEELPAVQRAILLGRTEFENNTVGQNAIGIHRNDVRGGGAIYSLSADPNVVKGVYFNNNTVKNGNGGAIALVNPLSTTKRYFVTDLDMVGDVDADGVYDMFVPDNRAFTYHSKSIFPLDPTAVSYAADVRMQTRFTNNSATLDADQDWVNSQMGSGSTQIGTGIEVTTNPLFGTWWTSTTEGYAVGMRGEIVHITGGGSNWNYQTNNVDGGKLNIRLNKVRFTENNTGYIVGNQGTLLKTDNKGANWSKINLGTFNDLTDIYFVDPNLGFITATGGLVYKTTNAGATWTAQTPTTKDLNGVYFTSTSIGYLVGNDKTILKTTDAGTTWTSLVVVLPNYDFTTVSFVGNNKGFVFGRSGVMVMTNDGGASWNQITSPTTSVYTSLTFTNQNVAYATTQNGSVVKTIDGGVNWTIDTKASNYNTIWASFFATTTTGYMTGDRGAVYKTTDAGATWNQVKPSNAAHIDVVRYHASTDIPENGIGLGGALFILDEQTDNRIGRTDSVNFSRVRFQRNSAYTGSVVYSDNYDLKLILNKSLVANNTVNSTIGYAQNAILGPVRKDASGAVIENRASNDLVGATIYGELQGPLPSYEASISANSIYSNSARFIVRLPDAPHTKGILAGSTGIGLGGTDTLRGNWWGQTEANVNVRMNRTGSAPAVQETFFINGDGLTHLPYVYGKEGNTTNPEQQGPFESSNRFSYVPVPLMNDANSEDIAAANTIPDSLLMSGKIYDLYDKGTDIKVADYSKRRMSPIEDFAVGLPNMLKTFTDAKLPSYHKYVRRMSRDPYCVDDAASFPNLAALQDEIRPDKNGKLVHPIGYPLYLESMADYSGIVERSNHDPLSLNQSVFFVINESTGDYIRVNMNQVGEDAPYREVYRATVELVPDSSGNRAILDRRSSDGLANFGNNTKVVLENLFREAYNEDGASLAGRKYVTGYNNLGNATNLFSNRPAFNDPTSNVAANQNGQVTFFGGERYRALPVNVGDVVRVISRTHLWKNGVNAAFDSSLAVTVTRSTEIPLFTGDVVELSTDTIVKILPSEYPDKQYNKIKDTVKLTEFLHTVFVSEDRSYPQPAGTFSTLKTLQYPDANIFGDVHEGETGRDSIFTLTAVDSNNYYDPRSVRNPELFTNIMYRAYMSAALENWITVDTVYSNSPAYDNAKGYLVFKGQPTNPYVVPGGEPVIVEAYNFPPNWRTYELIRNSDSISADEKNKFIETFPSYYNAQTYAEGDVARFLQQDTIDLGYFNKAEYGFKIFVVDSIPRYLDENYSTETIVRNWPNSQEMRDTLVEYTASQFACAPKNGKLIANLTDKLRFQMNINTDDELEDQWARKVHNWDFRYGQTSYGFLNSVRNGGDWDNPVDIVVDTVSVMDDQGNYVSSVGQVRPSWLSDKYLTRYATDDVADQFGQDFTSRGELNIRIDGTEAYSLLTPNFGNDDNINRPLNLDTNFILIVNDGHGGRMEKQFDIFINVKPSILPANLPAAEEGTDYNWELTDTNRRIKVYDPNFGQSVKFELIYAGEGRTEVAKDPCFVEAGSWDLSDKKTTPDWLKINEQSGKLYGVPGIKDAPSQEVVWVLVTDEEGLTDLRSFNLTVDSARHKPRLLSIPSTQCVDMDQAYSDTLMVVDYDLLRNPSKNANETLTLSVKKPATGFVVEPSTITGNGTQDSVRIVVRSQGGFNAQRDADGKVRIIITVTDGVYTYDLEHVLNVSDETYFTANIKVSNSIGAFQMMQWGIADQNVSTGDNTDGNPVGMIDNNYCEYELPPLPVTDVFDTRWTIPTINGTLRNIYPGNVNRNQLYVAQIQPGGENGQTSPMYPLKIEWDMSEVPAVTDNSKNPTNSVWYLRDAVSDGDLVHVNMNTGEGRLATGFVGEKQGNNYIITVNNTSFTSFVIWRDWNNDVEVGYEYVVTGITSVNPNPVSTDATISFELNKAANVRMEVVDILGNVVAKIADANFAAGAYTLVWNGLDNNNQVVSSGNYQVRMVAGDNVSVVPVIKIK